MLLASESNAKRRGRSLKFIVSRAAKLRVKCCARVMSQGSSKVLRTCKALRGLFPIRLFSKSNAVYHKEQCSIP